MNYFLIKKVCTSLFHFVSFSVSTQHPSPNNPQILLAFSDSLSIQIGWIFIVVWKLKIRDLGTMCRPIRLRWRNDLPIKQEICVIWIGDGCIDFTVVVLQPCSIKHVHRTYDLCQSCSVCRIDRGPKRYPNWGPNWGTQCFAPTL